MPGYLTTEGIDAALHHLVATYPSFCHAVTLPEPSVEGRTIRAVRIGTGKGKGKDAGTGVFFLAGVHAREVVNPDLLLSFGYRLCRAYAAGSSLSFGPKSYRAAEVKHIVEGLSLYLLPLANPDGRVWAQDPQGCPMWRKNRRPNPASPRCHGVDINRNFDFLWSSGLGASTRPCSDVFRGPEAFSEPETRNVRHLLDAHPDIRLFVDLHSYGDDVLYPWGDHKDQSDDPLMSFTNPAFDRERNEPHDKAYREYIADVDKAWFLATAGGVRDAIEAVRGRTYKVSQSVGLYPTSGPSDDYSYSRVHTGKATKVMAFTVETAREFQPRYAEAEQVIAEVSAGLVAYCHAALGLEGEGRRA